jgi:predicted RNA-binding protein YlqC (UPF0109 family)
MKELLEMLVLALVDKPDDVQLSEHREEDETIFEIDCDPSDRGRIIGKRGRTIDALRALMGAAGDRRGEIVDVEVLD